MIKDVLCLKFGFNKLFCCVVVSSAFLLLKVRKNYYFYFKMYALSSLHIYCVVSTYYHFLSLSLKKVFLAIILQLCRVSLRACFPVDSVSMKVRYHRHI